MNDQVVLNVESGSVNAQLGQFEFPNWKVEYVVRKWNNRNENEIHLFEPDEVIHGEGNLLMTAGALQLWKALRGDGSLTAFSNANSYLGVGDSSTAASAGQTDLQAATNKTRKAMDSTYPKVGTADSLDADNKVRFQSTFGTSDANYAWNEWGTFNASTAGTMLNRKAEALGTKVNTATWQLQVTITLS